MRSRCALGLRLARSRRVDDRGRQDALCEVVDAFEPAPCARGDRPGPEQPLQGALAVTPVPPSGLARSISEVAAGERTLLLDALQDGVDVVAPLATERRDAAPRLAGPRALHPPAEQGLSCHGKQGRLMTPVLEQERLPAPGGLLKGLARVGPQPGERRKVVAARQHIDRVDLDHTQAVDQPLQPRRSHRSRRRRTVQALSGNGDPARLSGRQVGPFSQPEAPRSDPDGGRTSPAVTAAPTRPRRPPPSNRNRRSTLRPPRPPP